MLDIELLKTRIKDRFAGPLQDAAVKMANSPLRSSRLICLNCACTCVTKLGLNLTS